MQITSDDDLSNSINGFIELGRLRNQRVHQNFVTFLLEKTPDELYSMFLAAHLFVSEVSEWFRKYCLV